MQSVTVVSSTYIPVSPLLLNGKLFRSNQTKVWCMCVCLSVCLPACVVVKIVGAPELTKQIWGQPQLALVSTDCRIQKYGHTGKKATSHRVASILGCQKKKNILIV